MTAVVDLRPRIARARLEGDPVACALVEALAHRLQVPATQLLYRLSDERPGDRLPRPHDPTPLAPPDPAPSIDPYAAADAWRPKGPVR